MAKDEKTSIRVAKIAGKILKLLKSHEGGYLHDVYDNRIISINDVKVLAASALTQTRDK